MTKTITFVVLIATTCVLLLAGCAGDNGGVVPGQGDPTGDRTPRMEQAPTPQQPGEQDDDKGSNDGAGKNTDTGGQGAPEITAENWQEVTRATLESKGWMLEPWAYFDADKFYWIPCLASFRAEDLSLNVYIYDGPPLRIEWDVYDGRSSSNPRTGDSLGSIPPVDEFRKNDW